MNKYKECRSELRILIEATLTTYRHVAVRGDLTQVRKKLMGIRPNLWRRQTLLRQRVLPDRSGMEVWLEKMEEAA